jgi:hypothetical protein
MTRSITEVAMGVRAISDAIGTKGGLASLATELDQLASQFQL